jgi:hypothetical protein
MAKIHDKFVIELAEVIKGYGNDPDVDDPFCLSAFYRFYELPEIAVSANHFKTMIPLEVEKAKERKTGKWIDKSDGIDGAWNYCSVCGEQAIDLFDFCPNCGADMRGEPDV